MSYPWHVRDAINEATSSLAKSYEVAALRNNVDSLECSLRETRAEADGLRSQLQEVAQGVASLTDIVNGMMDRIHELEANQLDSGVENDLVHTNGPFGVGA